MKPQNLAIVTLTISALVLGAMLVGSLMTDTAEAGYSSVNKGDYIMIPYSWNDQRDVMTVIHIPTGKMVVYGLNVSTNGIEIVDTVDLSRMFSN